MAAGAEDRITIEGRDYVRNTDGLLIATVQHLEWTESWAAPAQDDSRGPGNWRRGRTIWGCVWLNADRIGLAGLLLPGYPEGRISITSAGEDSHRTEITLVDSGERRLCEDFDLMVSITTALPAEIFDRVWLAVLGGADHVELTLIADFYRLEEPPAGGGYCEWYLKGRSDEAGLTVETAEARLVEASAGKGRSAELPVTQPLAPVAEAPPDVLRVARTIRWALPAIFALLVLIFLMLTR